MVIKQGLSRPWARVDPVVAETLRSVVPAVIEDAMDRIVHDLPTLGSDVVGRFGEALRLGIHQALRHFTDLLGRDVSALDDQLLRMYVEFGAREDRHGRSMEALLAAYRLGARTTWAHFSVAAIEDGAPPRQIALLAEALFVYIDELSAASATGFSRAQVERAAQREQARRRLAEALVAGVAGSDPSRTAELAANADWELPERLAVAVHSPSDGGAGDREPTTDAEVLVLRTDDEVLLVLPERDGVLADPQRWVRCYVGTVRAAAEASLSLAHARTLRRLVAEGVVPIAPVVAAADHLPELVLHADDRLYAELCRRALAPLDGLTRPRREIAVRTIAAWLALGGDRSAVADALGVHPQTVSYRLGQLAELFDGGLDDPAVRGELLLATYAVRPERGPVLSRRGPERAAR